MNEQIQNILNENGTKTSKIQKLLSLGLTRRQVADLVANGNYGFGCFRYHKGTDFQANHNAGSFVNTTGDVVLDTTKVLIFKQITTRSWLFS